MSMRQELQVHLEGEFKSAAPAEPLSTQAPGGMPFPADIDEESKDNSRPSLLTRMRDHKRYMDRNLRHFHPSSPLRLLKQKENFLTELRAQIKGAEGGELLFRSELLELFNVLSTDGMRGEFGYMHISMKSNAAIRFRLFFKQNRNPGEANFWHTKAYQQAVGLIKTAYLIADDNIKADDVIKKAQEARLLDYVRGNASAHSAQTSTRRAFGG